MLVSIVSHLTDNVIQPRLKNTEVDGVPVEASEPEALTPKQNKALRWTFILTLLGILLLIAMLVPGSSPVRDAQSKPALSAAPVMQSVLLLRLLAGFLYDFMLGGCQRFNVAID